MSDDPVPVTVIIPPSIAPLTSIPIPLSPSTNLLLLLTEMFSFFTKPVIYGSLAARLSHVPNVVGMIEGLGSPFTIHPNGQSFKMKFVQIFQVLLYRIVFPFLDRIIFLNSNDPSDLIEKNNYFYPFYSLFIIRNYSREDAMNLFLKLKMVLMKKEK